MIDPVRDALDACHVELKRVNAGTWSNDYRRLADLVDRAYRAKLEEPSDVNIHGVPFSEADLRRAGQDWTDDDVKVRLMPSAVAGLRELQTGDAGVPVIPLTEHEVTDLVLSGSAFTLDGRYKLTDPDGRLRPLEQVWQVTGKLRPLTPEEATVVVEKMKAFLHPPPCRHLKRVPFSPADVAEPGSDWRSTCMDCGVALKNPPNKKVFDRS